MVQFACIPMAEKFAKTTRRVAKSIADELRKCASVKDSNAASATSI
jgi:hypothetical protein